MDRQFIWNIWQIFDVNFSRPDIKIVEYWLLSRDKFYIIKILMHSLFFILASYMPNVNRLISRIAL